MADELMQHGNAWKGGRTIGSDGYVYVWSPDHPHAMKVGYVREHLLIVATAIGRPLPRRAEVHHFDGDRANNATRNLVACEDSAYHALLHRRQEALRECGHAHWMRCGYCSEWDDPGRMYVRPNGRSAFHRECFNSWRRRYRARKAAEAFRA